MSALWGRGCAGPRLDCSRAPDRPTPRSLRRVPHTAVAGLSACGRAASSTVFPRLGVIIVPTIATGPNLEMTFGNIAPVGSPFHVCPSACEGRGDPVS
jgi:hypothetical protein